MEERLSQDSETSSFVISDGVSASDVKILHQGWLSKRGASVSIAFRRRFTANHFFVFFFLFFFFFFFFLELKIEIRFHEFYLN